MWEGGGNLRACASKIIQFGRRQKISLEKNNTEKIKLILFSKQQTKCLP